MTMYTRQYEPLVAARHDGNFNAELVFTVIASDVSVEMDL
jgi:hypothetical protein